MSQLANILAKHTESFHPVVQFDSVKEKLQLFNFTKQNKELTDNIIGDTIYFQRYIDEKLKSNHAKFGIGGYGEDRVLYKRSTLFNLANAAKTKSSEGDIATGRTIHLGIDIWGPAGTEVYAPMGGMVHSFAFNDNFGDYGATIILQHQLQTLQFHTLYGHVSLDDLDGLQEGQYVTRGQLIAHFGTPEENGDWPPHLHFQVIDDIRLKEGDYPGVCTPSEKEFYLKNCPDADLILDMMRYTRV